MAVTYHGGSEYLPNSNPNAKEWVTTVDFGVSGGTSTDAFEIPGALGYVEVGLVNTGTPTLTLQVTGDDTTDSPSWTSTEITATGSTSAKQLLTSDTMAAIAGLAGHGLRFRWISSGSVIVDIKHFSTKI